MKTRIKLGMPITEIVSVMSDGNTGASIFLMMYLNSMNKQEEHITNEKFREGEFSENKQEEHITNEKFREGEFSEISETFIKYIK